MPFPAQPDERDPDSLARYLLSFRWPGRDEAVHRALVAEGLPLWRRILSLVPELAERGRALEIGSPPFQLSILLQRLRDYALSLAALGPAGADEVGEELESPDYGELF